MLNVNVRKLILVSILIVSLLALVFLWPFSMRIVSDAEDYQEVAKRALDNSTRQLSALVTKAMPPVEAENAEERAAAEQAQQKLYSEIEKLLSKSAGKNSGKLALLRKLSESKEISAASEEISAALDNVLKQVSENSWTLKGENVGLLTAMRRLGTAGEKLDEWELVKDSSDYKKLSDIASVDYGNSFAWFIVRFILCVLLIAAFITSVVMLGQTTNMLLILGALIMVFPFYWMIASSFKTATEMNLFPPTMMPRNWTNVENYTTAWHTAPFATYFFNSIFVCVCSVGVVMFTTILAAFAFSRLQFPGRDLLFTLLLSMMMVPFELLVITNYQTITRLGMRDTLASLILPFTSSIFYTYILRNFFMSVPDSLYYSSQVDGSSNWQYLWKVMVPIASPSLVTILLLNAMASWNSFMWPKLVISRDEVRTLPWALITFTTEVGIHYELIMAGATMVVLPMLILFLFARKQIVRGVARGGIKG